MADEIRHARVADWAKRWNAGLERFLKRRVAVPVDAQDLAQEVYLRLLRAQQLDLVVEPQAYLYRVARNVAAEWRVRASQSKPHSADELDELVEARRAPKRWSARSSSTRGSMRRCARWRHPCARCSTSS